MLNVCLLPPEIVSSPPTVTDGELTLEEENDQRAYACGWIQKAAILLRVPAESLASGQTILHRFYYRRSMKEFDLKLVGAASLYLACKLCETPRRIRDVVHVVVFLDWLEKKDQCLQALRSGKDQSAKPEESLTAPHHQSGSKDNSSSNQSRQSNNACLPSNTESNTESSSQHPIVIPSELKSSSQIEEISVLLQNLDKEIKLPDIHSKEFRRLKTNIHRVERHILRQTGFTISQTLIHPHRYILQFIHIIFGDSVFHSSESKSVICQRAWGYLNDSLRTPLCCSVQPSVTAAAAISMACSDYGVELPTVKLEIPWRDGKTIERDADWFEGFQVEKEELDRVISAIKQLYNVEHQPSYRKLADPPVPPAATLHSGQTTQEAAMCDARLETSECRDGQSSEAKDNE